MIWEAFEARKAGKELKVSMEQLVSQMEQLMLAWRKENGYE